MCRRRNNSSKMDDSSLNLHLSVKQRSRFYIEIRFPDSLFPLWLNVHKIFSMVATKGASINSMQSIFLNEFQLRSVLKAIPPPFLASHLYYNHIFPQDRLSRVKRNMKFSKCFFWIMHIAWKGMFFSDIQCAASLILIFLLCLSKNAARLFLIVLSCHASTWS